MVETTLEQKHEISFEELSERPSLWSEWWRTMMRDKKAAVGLTVLVAFMLVAVFAPWLSPYDPNDMEYEMMESLTWEHLLGTDDLGRDLLSRIIYGTRISLFIGISTVLMALVIGVFMGLVAGYYGGWIDNIVMRFIDLIWAFPNIIVALYLVVVLGTGIINIMVAITLAFVDDFARVVRGMVLSIKEEQYISAAKALGLSDFRIMWRHILPNATAPVIVQATVSVSYAILGEATLSFLGLGVEASTPTWGLILSEGQSFISRAWWLGLFPGFAIMLTVLSVNFLGDALRDFLDVREVGDIGG